MISLPACAYRDRVEPDRRLPRRPDTCRRSIIVGAGSTYVANQQGVSLPSTQTGRFASRSDSRDVFNEWDGRARRTPTATTKAIFSTPAVGDITGDGQQDIVFGSYDHRLYALTPDGELVPGFPIDTEDTIWSSPALYHVRGPRHQVDIFIGGDASGRDGCYGGFVYDVTYETAHRSSRWQHCENQTIWSSPAVGVINARTSPVVVVGTGFGETPPYKSGTNRLFAFYARSGQRVRGVAGEDRGTDVRLARRSACCPAVREPAVVDTSWCTSCTGLNARRARWSTPGRRRAPCFGPRRSRGQRLRLPGARRPHWHG